MTISLPTPNTDQQAHSQLLVNHINRHIVENGPLPFVEFMQMALYQPGMGYYVAGSHKIGEQGDFVTAPEISPMFSYALANQCAKELKQFGGGDVLEFGAGTGRMAHDVLTQLQQLNQLPDHYYILEVSPELIERQQQTLSESPELLQRVKWLSELPQNFKGVVLANEVLDAMTVELFCYHEDTIHRGLVGQVDNQWQLLWQTCKDDWLPADIIEHKNEWPQPYLSEFNPSLADWLQQLSDVMDQGTVLLIDYGFTASEYYHPERKQGTLMCHYRHHAHADPLLYPGLQDITAHVDFTAVENAAKNAGFTVDGLTTQANFLLANNIIDFQTATDPELALKQSQQLQKLLMPNEMGELFKVMALTKELS
ncbi:MAG: SAM-dependent methyltransferase [Coxiellaceae bacterium]|nr:SAM-dependent methyltransferase [Coxiellaceae bacterium]